MYFCIYALICKYDNCDVFCYLCCTFSYGKFFTAITTFAVTDSSVSHGISLDPHNAVSVIHHYKSLIN